MTGELPQQPSNSDSLKAPSKQGLRVESETATASSAPAQVQGEQNSQPTEAPVPPNVNQRQGTSKGPSTTTDEAGSERERMQWSCIQCKMSKVGVNGSKRLGCIGSEYSREVPQSL